MPGVLHKCLSGHQAVPSAEKPADNKATLKKLMKNIPTDKDAVFAYPIKWDVYDKYSFSMAPKLSQWVLKKTAELLGEEELSMVEYVMNMLKEHVQVRRGPTVLCLLNLPFYRCTGCCSAPSLPKRAVCQTMLNIVR